MLKGSQARQSSGCAPRLISLLAAVICLFYGLQPIAVHSLRYPTLEASLSLSSQAEGLPVITPVDLGDDRSPSTQALVETQGNVSYAAPPQHSRRLQTFGNIRITPVYLDLEGDAASSPALAEYIRNALMPAAIQYYANALRTNPVQVSFKILHRISAKAKPAMTMNAVTLTT